MSIDAAHRRWWQSFEVVFGIPMLVAIGLQLVAPFSFPTGFPASVTLPTGAALVLLGATVVIRARRELARHGQPTDPGNPTTELVTTGVFSMSRNPLYLGGVCILAGIAVAGNFPWVLVLLVPALVACHYVLIAPEERYLAAHFGEEYAEYAKTVRRWFGRRRREGKPNASE